MDTFVLRDLQVEDLDSYIRWQHPGQEHHRFNGPYFPRASEAELEVLRQALARRLEARESPVLDGKQVVVDRESGRLLGTVNWYWKSEATRWMEVGIVLFDPGCWGRGLGARVLRRWIDEVFRRFPDLARLGLTTWSGNLRMVRLAEKLGLRREAVFRKARIVEGRYYDSVSYGVLREEWEAGGLPSIPTGV